MFSMNKPRGFVFFFTLFAVLLPVSAAAESFEVRLFERGSFETNQVRDFHDDENRIFNLVNQERRRKGLENLEWDEDLARLARSYSRQMARDLLFDHYDRDGNSVVERAANFRIRKWRKIGENLFFCAGYQNFSALAVRGWMKSDMHRRNILDEAWTNTGIGVAQARNNKIYITQVFLR